MIAEYATTLLVGATSAFLPVTPVEPYAIAVVATTGDAAWTTAAITRLNLPRQATTDLFTSAVTGLPPLLITSVHAARTSMSAVVFGITCLAGRTIRFSLVASVPGLLDFLHPHL